MQQPRPRLKNVWSLTNFKSCVKRVKNLRHRYDLCENCKLTYNELMECICYLTNIGEIKWRKHEGRSGYYNLMDLFFIADLEDLRIILMWRGDGWPSIFITKDKKLINKSDIDAFDIKDGDFLMEHYRNTETEELYQLICKKLHEPQIIVLAPH